MARINIPTNPGELIALAEAIVAKHTADGDKSPLAGLDMATMVQQTTVADTQNKQADKLYRDAETATQTRDNALGNGGEKGTVAWFVRSVRDILSGLNKGNEQKLGDWGFTVDQSVKSATSAKPAPPATAAK